MQKISFCQLVYIVNHMVNLFFKTSINILLKLMVYRFTGLQTAKNQRLQVVFNFFTCKPVVYKLSTWFTTCKPRTKGNLSNKKINSTYICLMITTKIRFELFLNFNKSPERVLFGRSQFGALSF